MKEKICKLLSEGRSYDYIVSKVGCSKSTISYHAKKSGLSKKVKSKDTMYDWDEISKYYESHTYKETREKFGFWSRAWEKAIDRGDIVSRGNSDFVKDLDEIISGKHPSYGTNKLKKRLFKAGILKEECEECGIGNIYNDKPLVLHLDHKNGINNDHRLENLRILCPNCHSQTETYAGKNSKKL